MLEEPPPPEPPEPPADPAQPETLNGAVLLARRSPSWDLKLPMASPDGVAQVVAKTASGPPESVTCSAVSGISGSCLKVVEFVARSTLPFRVSVNGAGKGDGDGRRRLNDPVR